MKRYNQRKLSLAISLILIGFGAGLVSISEPIAQYTKTIFGQIPLAAAIALFLGCTLAFFQSLRSALNGVAPYCGISVLICGYLVYFSLPEQAGVILYGGHASDILIHISIARTIANTGFASPTNWYPLFHIELAIYKIITNTALPRAQRVFPVLLLIIFALGMGLVGREFGSQKKLEWMSFLLALPMVFAELNGSFHPTMIVFFIFPLFAYTILQQGGEFIFTSLILGILIAFMHPLGSLISIAFTSVYVIAHITLTRSGDILDIVNSTKGKFIEIIIFTLIWSYWFFSFETTSVTIARNLGLLSTSEALKSTSGEGTGILAFYLQALGGATPPAAVIEQILHRFAPMMLYALLTGVALVYLAIKYWTTDRPLERNTFVLVAVCFVGVAISMSFFIADFILTNPVRAGRWAVIGAIPVIGRFLYRDVSDFSNVGEIILILLFLSSIPLGLFAADTENQHLRYQTVSGAEWQLSHRNANIHIKSQSLSSNLNIYISGPTGPNPLNYALENQTLERPTRLHSKNMTLSHSYGCSYLVALEYDLKYYKYLSQSRRDGKPFLNDGDVRQIESSFSHIYTNGGADIWKTC